MPECPKCGKEINDLIVYSSEVNRYAVTLRDEPEPQIDWDRTGVLEDTCTGDTFHCIECEQPIFETDGKNSQPQIVIDFLADYIRCCAKCKHFNPKDSTCPEGGFTEIGNPYQEITEEYCNAWEAKKDG